MASPPIDELGERLGIVLRDPEAIRQAFVHSSFLNEHPAAAPGHNERLEFLGDAARPMNRTMRSVGSRRMAKPPLEATAATASAPRTMTSEAKR